MLTSSEWKEPYSLSKHSCEQMPKMYNIKIKRLNITREAGDFKIGKHASRDSFDADMHLRFRFPHPQWNTYAFTSVRLNLMQFSQNLLIGLL